MRKMMINKVEYKLPVQITITGKVTPFDPSVEISLEAAYEKCCIDASERNTVEVVTLVEDKIIMIVDGEGKFNQPKNIIATRIAHGFCSIQHTDFIAGNVIICESTQFP